jgi:predicted helicase
MKFDKILEKYRKMSFSERDKGNRFERLMQAYLLTDPKYAYKFKKVWLWNEFVGRKDMGGTDTGIDLVALTVEGDFWAIQCKCFNEDASIDKPAVDSFLATSSREFKDEGLKTARFAHRLWISTTNHWGKNAEEAIKNQNPPVTRLNLYELQEAGVDWGKLDKGIFGEESREEKKELRPHQIEALGKTIDHFKAADRGKLIMACGTGKTLNSLRIAETQTKGRGFILFLVPSIALLGQTLREWAANAYDPINAVCICSDPEISKKTAKGDDSDITSVIDLALPASTNVKDIVHQVEYFKKNSKTGMTVFFSTYQSIDVVAKAQKKLSEIHKSYSEFDLIICDEAHRTTGVSLTEEDSSAFIKVHDNKYIKGKKRLYMTATPRLYSDDAKSKAAQADAILCSMDDPDVFGDEMYRIGFGEAVDKGLLTDYKVLILTLSDKDVPPAVQRMLNKDSEVATDDVSKLIGCINALSKQILGDEGVIKATDPEPMRRAVAFCQKIAVSKAIKDTFNTATEAYISSLPSEKKEQMVSVEAKHIDGTMAAPERDELLRWLKSDGEPNECRVLTNVRCLSEGVDVPSLDAVMFLSARNSQVDVVQSVGRVMRKSNETGKKYGYIIIPVVVPSDVPADKALDDNERYKVVWTVLNALRAHDDRFNATVNKIELNKKRPPQILVGRPDYTFENGKPISPSGESQSGKGKEIAEQLALQFEQLQSVVFARMVQKVGDKRYWEQWAKNVAEIADRQTDRINLLIKENGKHKKAFESFLAGLQKNINPSITQQEAVEMLSQHTITKPVFEALFQDYSFVKHNPISVSMQKMLSLLEAQAVEKDTETLNKFYESVKKRAQGIDNAEGKQRIIIELYDKFFKTAFPKMVDRLGIVYTPVEIVDFIIHSVDHVLEKEFGRKIGDENIHILDPFTGTGTFITRLLQSGLISKRDLQRKYQNEIHANEIVLLAYYIAAVNIENAFHDVTEAKDYQAFNGICLTDTFQLGETDESASFLSEIFPQNSERVLKQKKAPLRVIMGNPPYSAGQKSANDNAQNQKYSRLDDRISETYVERTKATNKNSLYDSYIKAFRWASDRLDRSGGVICFVSNGAWIDGNAQDGFRKCLEEEFSTIYVLNLRGNQRTSGELSRKEGGKIFGSGSRTPISITLLVKKPGKRDKKNKIYYYDIGDYLTREEKLDIIKNIRSVGSTDIKWKELEPNEHGDWISQRSESFASFIPIGDKEDKNNRSTFFIPYYSNGVKTQRDAWCYNFNKTTLINNIQKSVVFYNEQSKALKSALAKNPKLDSTNFLNYDSSKISWTRALIWDAEKGKIHSFEKAKIVQSIYRPFNKQFLYFSRDLNEMVYQMPKLFPSAKTPNAVICVSGLGGTKDNTAFITNSIVDLNCLDAGTQCFPLYCYEERKLQSPTLFDADDDSSEFIRKDALSDFILSQAQKIYGKRVTKEDIFYYVYGFLHYPKYRQKFADDLKKMLPRLPLIDNPRDFWVFSKAGRELANLHINYESIPAYPGVKVRGAESKHFEIEKMRFPKKDQKDTIIFNSKISVENIPEKAYEYVVNGKSAIEWVMERYKRSTHEESGITNDPNDWAKEVGNPRYILDVLLSVINVSVKTVEIVESLPEVKFE